MRVDKTSKKKKRKAAHVLLPVVALLVVALVAVAMLYLRAAGIPLPTDDPAAPEPKEAHASRGGGDQREIRQQIDEKAQLDAHLNHLAEP